MDLKVCDLSNLEALSQGSIDKNKPKTQSDDDDDK